MAKAKTKQKSPFQGHWRIVSMSAWEDDFLDEEVEAYIEFNDRGWGDFQFGNVQGQMDCRQTTREGEPAVEWSWDGNAEMDAALTRRVKESGDHWVVAEKKGRKVFSRGVWAPAATIERIRADLEAERSTEGYARRKKPDARRRENAQAEYVEDFLGAVVTFLAFHGNYADFANRIARAVTDHATPVGNGTVARTKRIPVEQRAEAAVIA